MPAHLKRRFNLLSGLLETADLEFNRLTTEIEDYKNKVKSSNLEDLLDLDINRLSLISFLNLKFQDQGLDPKKYTIAAFDNSNNLTYDLHKFFGLKNIKDINTLWEINKDKIFSLNSNYDSLNTPYVRMFFILDLGKALEVYKKKVNWIFSPLYQTLIEMYDKETVHKIAEELELEILDMTPEKFIEELEKIEENPS